MQKYKVTTWSWYGEKNIIFWRISEKNDKVKMISHRENNTISVYFECIIYDKMNSIKTRKSKYEFMKSFKIVEKCVSV